ncbi:BirA family biotin operon repressor/biotin-[acetyl-CoA-carboxylase] ligase [Cricetibacter osteomyelitidis]|uniref:biotin--[biotin carboxyl-carrier protein] ligase n=1 Tax=Cricetibacter osteomyelitidis TaxID=1521931 RepID=A0A4R2T7W7_9PAST|nr:bifunctional biotin--[acetyl-CoA-carboxylase] ligase/biotin operon repressor BirA [Cricetibacter osteomyelitidis]TCP97656.1 BirA family biotin operon repressor/biotin-[acetyl-CoA-carboxylase] ligase [Cricetibacter osteomyelitidis]
MQPLDSQFLSIALLPNPVIVFNSIDSTNEYLLTHLADLPKGSLCLAEEQTAGRGRRGRAWKSPFGGQIIMSLYWTFDPGKSIEGMSSVIGLAITDSLKQAGATGVAVKWPNDILLNGRKLAGILVEISNHKNGLLNAVIGIGINLSLGENPPIDQAWAELKEVLPNLNRNQLIVNITKNLHRYLIEFEQQGISENLRQQWFMSDYYLNQPVNIISAQQTVSGIERGIDEKGYVLIETSGGLLKFNGGEVSLRKR